MTKLRVFVFILTLIIVGTFGTLVSLYARGYRLDFKTLRILPSGILVIKSDPDGASVFINGELKTATNATISVSPGTYDVSIKRDGYFAWEKRLAIEKEVVTEANASLFRTIPSLTPITFSPTLNPIASDDTTKIAYSVPFDLADPEKSGLWLIETINLPLGFSRDPRRITDGDLKDAIYEFSPDGREILLTTKLGVFLLDSSTFTPQAQRINVASRKLEILQGWANERKIKLEAQMRNLPEELAGILRRKTTNIVFSSDDTKILYTASESGTLRENLITPLPGSSTQKQERNIKEHQTYIYDIKEDRNFLITDQEINPLNTALRWFPTSRHLIEASEGKITIMDYDGTNRQVIYSGVYSAPHAYPFVNTNKLLILTNLGANASPPNFYSLSLK